MTFVIVVAVGWMYVAVMMAVVEATSSTGTVLGAIFTFLLYGVLPLAIALYLLTTLARRRARLAALRPGAAMPVVLSARPDVDPDERGHPSGDAVAPIRKEP